MRRELLVSGVYIMCLGTTGCGGLVGILEYVHIRILAGNGVAGDVDGATGAAEFNHPLNAAVDLAGNVYVSDSRNNKIRKIALNGDVSTLAGNGSPGLVNGHGGSNGSAEFSTPWGVAVDDDGIVYVGDFGNRVIRTIDLSGNVTTIVTWSSSGEAPCCTSPAGIAVDREHDIFVADVLPGSVRKIDLAGQVTTVLAPGAFVQPEGVAVDALGNVYVAESQFVKKISADGGVSVLYSSRLGSASALDAPMSVAVSSTGQVFFSDRTLEEIEPDGGLLRLSPNVGSEPAGSGGVNGTAHVGITYGVAVDAFNDVYVAEAEENRVLLVQVMRP